MSALRTHKDLTLPSVESWGTNMNILRDPPKSIQTRKIDKVGQDMSIVEQIDASGDRMCEGISVYARGVNQMVDVSYSNSANNGGGNALTRSGQAQSSLPYKIIPGGSFRPPIISPRDLLPLSRQPRLVTQAITNPSAVNYAKKALCPSADKMKQIRKVTLEKNNIRPTAVYKSSKIVKDIDTSQYVIKDPVNITGYSGTKTMANRANLKHRTPTREINDRVYKVVTTNPYSDTRSKNVKAVMDTDKYLKDVQYKSVIAKPTRKGDGNNYVNKDVDLKRNVPVHTLIANPTRKGDGNKYVNKDVDLKRNVPVHTLIANPTRKGDGNKYVNKTVELKRNVPMHIAASNPGKIGYGDFYANNAREAKLTPKIKVEQGIQYLGNLGESKVRMNHAPAFRNTQKCQNQKATQEMRSVRESTYI